MAGIDVAYSQTARVNYSNPWQEKTLYTNQQEKIATGIEKYWEQNNNVEHKIGPAYKLQLSTQPQNDLTNSEIKRMKQTGKVECQTCKERKYQDGSNDPGVSFKTPAHISPENSAAVVRSHEQEHVSNEQVNAQNKGQKVLSQSVQVFTAVCPECGKSYVSGGETHTTTANNDSAPQSSKQESSLGSNVDLVA